MILGGPVKGYIHIDARYYPSHPRAWHRPGGNHAPAVNHDFGPSTVSAEPTVKWPGGGTNIYGRTISAGTYQNFHLGIDIEQVGCGYSILAAENGTVIFSGTLIGGSRAIVIRHADGVATGYSHLATRSVKKGAKVKKGQKIGTMGKTGQASGCHLHFAVKIGFPVKSGVNGFYNNNGKGKFVDPWSHLAQNANQ